MSDSAIATAYAEAEVSEGAKKPPSLMADGVLPESIYSCPSRQPASKGAKPGPRCVVLDLMVSGTAHYG